METSDVIGKIIGFLFCGGFVVIVLVVLVAVAKAARRRQLEMAHGAGGRKDVVVEREAPPLASPVEESFEVVAHQSLSPAIDRTNLQRAFIWADIVGPPVSERDADDEMRAW